ncbi:MAG: DUF4062 domain-containing protein [Sulfuritalea sp.]|jgi:hypothetical protein|nr:DUF4062 domain-containing protein [Sulfuritalea sp.]
MKQFWRWSPRHWLFQRPVEVFLSSTSSLGNERLAVKEALDEGAYRLFCFEEHPAEKRSPKTVCAEKIDQADVFLGLIGPDFGSPLPDNPNCGIVQWEFERARDRAEQSALELKPYVRRGALDAASDQRQRQFIERITAFDTGLWVKWFADPGELKTLVEREMREWLEATGEAFARPDNDLSRFASRLLTPVALVAVSASLVAGFLGIKGSITPTSALLAALVSIAIILACLSLHKQV